MKTKILRDEVRLAYFDPENSIDAEELLNEMEKMWDEKHDLNDSPSETKGEAEARTAAEDYNFLRALAGAN